jgi:hypothetical protein
VRLQTRAGRGGEGTRRSGTDGEPNAPLPSSRALRNRVIRVRPRAPDECAAAPATGTLGSGHCVRVSVRVSWNAGFRDPIHDTSLLINWKCNYSD